MCCKNLQIYSKTKQYIDFMKPAVIQNQEKKKAKLKQNLDENQEFSFETMGH
jgi:hypothetical protein